MGLGKGLVWLFLRNTKPGSKYLYGAERAAFEGLMTQAALQAWREYQVRREADSRWKIDTVTGREVKAGRNEWVEGQFKLSVIDGYFRDYDRYVTDILVIPTTDNPSGSGQHLVIDGDGNVLLNEWHEKK